jgi:hypothetical protein
VRAELCHRRVQQLAALLPDAVRRRDIETATHPGDLVAGFDTELNLSFEQVFPRGGPETVSAVAGTRSGGR